MRSDRKGSATGFHPLPRSWPRGRPRNQKVAHFASEFHRAQEKMADPDAHQPAAVLASVKDKPSGRPPKVGAVLDRRCARRPHDRAGRDGRMAPAGAEQNNGTKEKGKNVATRNPNLLSNASVVRRCFQFSAGKVKLAGPANDFSIVDHVAKALRAAGIPKNQIDKFCDGASASEESELRQVCGRWGDFGS
jgi:hypothetical protein